MSTVDVKNFNKCEYVFKYKRWDGDGPDNLTQKTPPRYVTDRGIEMGREGNHEQLILHYLQPHSPWVANALEEDRDLREYEDDWWGYLDRTGDTETVWEAYLNDLRYVLDDVEIVLSNVDAEKVAITADHGNAFGEWGAYSHGQSYIGSVREVPWVETTAQDAGEYEPEQRISAVKDMITVEDKLRALGYKA